MKEMYWAIYRAYRRTGWRLIEALIRHFRWHNTILGTSIPNVRCLKLKAITLVNSYGQERSYPDADGKIAHTGFAGTPLTTPGDG